jgi:hypothetical protein
VSGRRRLIDNSTFRPEGKEAPAATGTEKKRKTKGNPDERTAGYHEGITFRRLKISWKSIRRYSKFVPYLVIFVN